MSTKEINLNLGNLAIESYSPSVAIPVTFTTDESFIEVRRSFSEITQTNKLNDFLYSNYLVIALLSIIFIAIAARTLILNQLSSQLLIRSTPLSKHAHISGLSISIQKNMWSTWLNQYENQQVKLNLGSNVVPLSPDLLKKWIVVTNNKNSAHVGVQLNSKLMSSTIMQFANQFTSSPVNQVEITRSNGTNETVVWGKNGTNFENSQNIVAQIQQYSKNIFSNNGFQINAPLVSMPFQSITPTSFSKLIVVDVNSKNMFIYQNGQLIKSYPVSAGAFATPTPIGEFHIYEKLPLQTMSGYNPNGTKYVQPNVEWIDYFSGADAIHGVYWHPLSWFGVHNSSHGCVGLPDSEAAWVYNWAPIGTTVITTPN
ncbi:MAG TPA: L,D-transpeptidase [Patescibacteria group bacterium]|nr:L,D-transpeptidase [Patescibacteria group bacterium]